MSRKRLSASRGEHRKPRRRRWERLNSKDKGETSNIEHPTPNIEFVKSVSSVVKEAFAVVVEDEDENDDEEECNLITYHHIKIR
jgi:hypothetical protein